MQEKLKSRKWQITLATWLFAILLFAIPSLVAHFAFNTQFTLLSETGFITLITLTLGLYHHHNVKEKQLSQPNQ